MDSSNKHVAEFNAAVTHVFGTVCYLCVRAGHENTGAARGTRTPDPVITNDVLYQLSYCGGPSKTTSEAGRSAWPPGIGHGSDWQGKAALPVAFSSEVDTGSREENASN